MFDTVVSWDCAEAVVEFIGGSVWDLLDLGYDAIVAKIWGKVEESAKYLAEIVFASYLDRWAEDIESGLQDWGTFGLALTKGLFDPHARRAYQNENCRGLGEGEAEVLINPTTAEWAARLGSVLSAL